MSEFERTKATVYVGGLDPLVTTTTLHSAFIPFGEIVDITLPKPDNPHSTDLHRGFGYVEFEVADDAKEAIDNMDQSELFGRTIRVAPSKPQKDRSEGLGSKTAIWEQEGWLARNLTSGEDGQRAVGQQAENSGGDIVDPMQALDQLDVAGPKAK